MDGLIRKELLEILREDQEEIAEFEAYKLQNPEFATQLEARLESVARGQRMFSPIATLEAWVSEGTAPDIVRRQVNHEKTRFNRLHELVRQHGWPGHALVGEDCALGAAAILAHADSEKLRRGELCERMREAVLLNDMDPRPYAHIVDRMAIIDNDEQEYGSLMGKVPDGRADFWWPVRDRSNIDRRRQKIGLPSAEEDLKKFAEGAKHGPFLMPLETESR